MIEEALHRTLWESGFERSYVLRNERFTPMFPGTQSLKFSPFSYYMQLIFLQVEIRGDSTS